MAIGGRASSIRVHNGGGFVMRFHLQARVWPGQNPATWESENTARFSMGQSKTLKAPDAFHGRIMWPRALVDLGSGQCDPYDDTPRVICDRYSPATAVYWMGGTTIGNPYFEWRGIENEVPPPMVSKAGTMDHLVGRPVTMEILSGLTSDRKFLSCDAGGKVDLWNAVGPEGRQKWNLTKVADTGRGPCYTIQVSGGTNAGEKYLSCTDSLTVDLYDRDDQSGRQRWYFVTSSLGPLTIQPESPWTQGFPAYLSCAPNGTSVDLWMDEDGSGRQRWKVVAA